MHVHPGGREVREPTGVVEVEVGQHDVGDVGRVQPEPEQLGVHRLARVQCRADHRAERLAPPLRVRHVAAAESGVDQQQALGPLDDQGVGDHLGRGEAAAEGPRGTHGGGVEVVDSHET